MTRTIRNEILTTLMIVPLLTAGMSMGFIQNSYAATIEPEDLELDMEPGETITIDKEITFEGNIIFLDVDIVCDPDTPSINFPSASFEPGIVFFEEQITIPENTPPGEIHCILVFIGTTQAPEPFCEGEQIGPVCEPTWLCNGIPIGPILQPCPPEPFSVTQTIWITVKDPTIDVVIDIKPGSDPSSVNCKNDK